MIGIGFFVALVGAVFMYLMWKSYQRASATRTWTETPAVMMVSKIKTRSDKNISKEYQWKLEYAYAFDDKEYTSKLHTLRGSKWTSVKKGVQNEIDAHPANSNVFCFVNPDEPTKAILEHDSKAAGYSIWFPALFVIGGIGIMWGAIKGMKPC